MDSVLQLLDELEEVLDSSRAVPFSNKVSIDKEEIYDIISEIRMKLPNELKQSKWVIEERNKILIDAQREADEIVKTAEEHDVAVIENKPLARGIYASTPLNAEIPGEYYGVVAEILGQVYKLKNKKLV